MFNVICFKCTRIISTATDEYYTAVRADGRKVNACHVCWKSDEFAYYAGRELENLNVGISWSDRC